MCGEQRCFKTQPPVVFVVQGWAVGCFKFDQVVLLHNEIDLILNSFVRTMFDNLDDPMPFRSKSLDEKFDVQIR